MKLGDETVLENKDFFAVRHLDGVYNLLMFSLAGFGGQNQSFSRCLDVEQLLCISRHCSSLYLERGQMR